MTICPYCKDGNHHLCMEGFNGGCECTHAQREGWEEEFDEQFEKHLAHNPNESWLESAEKQRKDIKSFIRQLLTHHTDKARREELERYTVSWDIADGGKNWEVQFWRKESDGTLTCVTRLNKESDDGGLFSLSALTHPVETKEEK